MLLYNMFTFEPIERKMSEEFEPAGLATYIPKVHLGNDRIYVSTVKASPCLRFFSAVVCCIWDLTFTGELREGGDVL